MSNRKVRVGCQDIRRVNSRAVILWSRAGSNLLQDNYARDNKSVARIKDQMVVPMQEGTVDHVTVVVSKDY